MFKFPEVINFRDKHHRQIGVTPFSALLFVTSAKLVVRRTVYRAGLGCDRKINKYPHVEYCNMLFTSMPIIIRLVLLSTSAADPHCDPQRARQITYLSFTPKLPQVDVLIRGLLLVFLWHARDSLRGLIGIL